MTLVDIVKSISLKLLKILKFYNERPICFFVTLGLVFSYVFIISNGFSWDFSYGIKRALLGNKYRPEEIWFGWGVTIVHFALLLVISKKINK